MKLVCCDKPIWVGDFPDEHCCTCGTPAELVQTYEDRIAKLESAFESVSSATGDMLSYEELAITYSKLLESRELTDEQIERGYIAFVRAQAEQADSGQECPRVAFEIGLCAALQKGEKG